jgi:hypothetical protein
MAASPQIIAAVVQVRFDMSAFSLRPFLRTAGTFQAVHSSSGRRGRAARAGFFISALFVSEPA